MMDEIDHHYLLSLGFNNARIVDPEKTLRLLRSTAEKAQVQLLKAKLIAGPEHLRFAARNALHSFRSKSPRSKSLAVEFLLYVSCQRQISKAIRLLGVEPTDRQVVLVALSESKEALQELERVSGSLLGEADGGLVDMTETPAIFPITSISTILSGFRSSTFLGTFEATASIISLEETWLRLFSNETLNVSSTPTFLTLLTTAVPIAEISHGTTCSTGLTLSM